VKEPVTERIDQGRVRDVVVPLGWLLRERTEGPVVEDEDVDAGEAGEETEVDPVGEGEFFIEPGGRGGRGRGTPGGTPAAVFAPDSSSSITVAGTAMASAMRIT
jgi:hypothetical protein